MFSSDAGFSSSWLFGDVRLLRGDREPCPVCGHPTGDCVGEGDTPQKAPQVKFTPKESAPRREPDPQVLVEHDIWQEVQVTPLTKTRVLVAKAGTYIDKNRAEQLGVI